MRNVFFIIIIYGLVSCTHSEMRSRMLLTKIDSLQKQLDQSYKPGFGEFMSSIQIHHSKLWFAGKNQNWKLADFELKEIKESLDGIREYCNDRPESKSIGMINQPIDSIGNAIRQKDTVLFKKNFILLTNTCNKCHNVTNHAFNIIKIPDNPPFSNQVFKIETVKQ